MRYGMDRDSIDVTTIADDDPTGFAFHFSSRILSRFEERSEHYLTVLAGVSHRKASFHIGHHNVDFPTHVKRPGLNDRENVDLWRITGFSMEPDSEESINAALKRVKTDQLNGTLRYAPSTTFSSSV